MSETKKYTLENFYEDVKMAIHDAPSEIVAFEQIQEYVDKREDWENSFSEYKPEYTLAVTKDQLELIEAEGWVVYRPDKSKIYSFNGDDWFKAELYDGE